MRCREGVVLDRPDVENAGVVDQHVQATECGDRGVHRSRPLRGLGNVEMDVAGRIGQFGGHRLALLVEDVAEHNLCAFGHHRPHMGCTHTARPAADKCDLSDQPSRHGFSSCFDALRTLVHGGRHTADSSRRL